MDGTIHGVETFYQKTGGGESAEMKNELGGRNRVSVSEAFEKGHTAQVDTLVFGMFVYFYFFLCVMVYTTLDQVDRLSLAKVCIALHSFF